MARRETLLPEQTEAHERSVTPAANFDGGIVPEIVRGFENDPGSIQLGVRLRGVGSNAEVFIRHCAE